MYGTEKAWKDDNRCGDRHGERRAGRRDWGLVGYYWGFYAFVGVT